MNINDRGSKKWGGFMLTEHTKFLSKLSKELKYTTKPQLDEQKCEEINNILCFAIAAEKTIKLTYFKQHAFHSVTGNIKKFDNILKQIQVYDLKGDFHTIILADIINIELDN